MIPATANFLAAEAGAFGATTVRAIILPYPHPTGILQSGWTLQNLALVAPGTLLATYGGFLLGFAVSPQMAANLGHYPSPAVFNADWNNPGYDLVLSWRSARTLAKLGVTAWTPLAVGDTMQFQAFYQWQLELTGVRCWAEENGAAPDELTAYAVDAAPDDYQSYAEEAHHEDDPDTYLKDIEFTGEFPVPDGDLEMAGTLTKKQPESFDEVIAGYHEGLQFNTRHGHYCWRRPEFFLAGDPAWYLQERRLKLQIGYQIPGRRQPELLDIYEGKIEDWGPIQREGDAGQLAPHIVEIYSTNRVKDLLNYRIGAPDAAGNPQPLLMGELLAEAEEVVGRALLPPLRTADFARGNLYELDRTLTAGGGSLTLVPAAPPDEPFNWVRAAVTGANQQAWGRLDLPVARDEIHLEARWRWTQMPATPADRNLSFLKIANATGATIVEFVVGADGKVWAKWGSIFEETDWDLEPYLGVDLVLNAWVKAHTTQGQIRLWLNNDEVLGWKERDLATQETLSVSLGLQTGAAAESWQADFGGLRLVDKYHEQAYQVPGGPFQAIKTVYVDDKTRRADLEKYPELGAVVFTDAEKEVSGTVLCRVLKDDRHHPVDQLQRLCELPGAGAYVNAAAFAAAKAATPNYRTGCRFEDVSAAEAIAEITRRCLFRFFADLDIRVSAYTGLPPGSPGLAVTPERELLAMKPALKLSERKNRVVVPFGWHERNPGLMREAKDPADLAREAKGEPVIWNDEEIDLTWQSPVATDSPVMARLVADLYLKRLGPRETAEPLRLTWRGARVEPADQVEVFDAFLSAAPVTYEVLRNVISLDVPRQAESDLVLYLGEE